MIITKEAKIFYSLIALLKVSRIFADDLVSSGEVARSLKHDLRVITNNIAHLERISNASLNGKDREQWIREWTEKDYEVYSAILFYLNDMSEDRRLIAEEFMKQLAEGKVKAQAA